jgi:hypothetical protein
LLQKGKCHQALIAHSGDSLQVEQSSPIHISFHRRDRQSRIQIRQISNIRAYRANALGAEEDQRRKQNDNPHFGVEHYGFICNDLFERDLGRIPGTVATRANSSFPLIHLSLGRANLIEKCHWPVHAKTLPSDHIHISKEGRRLDNRSKQL